MAFVQRASQSVVFALWLAACGGGSVEGATQEGAPGADGDQEGTAQGDGANPGDDPNGDGGDTDGADTSTGDGAEGDGAQGDGAAGDGSDSVGTRSACKRGVAYGYHSAADLTALSRGVTWWYNWAQTPDEGARDVYGALEVEYVPMIWGGTFDVDDVASRIPEGARTLLGFNEPNFFSQANLTAEQAAALWPQVEEVAASKGLAIASPALNYCGGGCNQTDPFAYLDAFFAACQGCKVDYIAAHWYACDGPALSWYLGELARYHKPIWLTEFACGDGQDRSLEAQKRYMQEAIPILEADPNVARYAWFAGRSDAIPNVDLLGADGQLTELGELYVGLPARAGCTP